MATQTNSLTVAIIGMLALHKCDAWRNNNAPIYDPTKQVFRRGNVRLGLSDVFLVQPDGRFGAVEVKSTTDKITPEQYTNLVAWRARGAFACVGRSVVQVQTEYLDYLAGRPQPDIELPAVKGAPRKRAAAKPPLPVAMQTPWRNR